ncbi:MAG: DUF3261 domain-containing protein [Myxococcales bacterium]
MLRQHVVARHAGRQGSFDAVLQKRGPTVLVVALTPFGTDAFDLEWRGGELRFRSHVAMELPFPARYVFDDVARTYFAGLPGAPLSDGVHVADAGGERITESWKDGRLLRRTFARLEGLPRGEIRIDYGGGMAGDRLPGVVEFDNGWIGYHLTISTVSEQAL